jgi:cation diffusion facilitator family transporter
MINWLIKSFIKDHEQVNDSEVRTKYGTLSSIVGISVNILLSLSKIVIGLLFNSIAVTADGINNLSDAASSVVTLVGFKMSSRPADKDHPFGHARIEYLTGLILGIAILLVGVELIRSSYGKIVNPEITTYSAVMIVVLVLSIFMKFWLSSFYAKIADRISSATIKAASVDSRNDVIATGAVLLAIIISKLTGLELDGYMGIVVALFIIYSGVDILKDILNPLLGEMPEPDFVEQIEKKLLSYDGILNIHDLVLHNYGPNRYFATVHAEVDAREDILKSHDLIDNIERDFARDLDINLVIHLDPIITDDQEINQFREMTSSIVVSIDERLSMHDFRVVKGETHTNLIFDVVVPAGCELDSGDLVKKIKKAIKAENETYYAVITIDTNYVYRYMNEPID